MFITPLFSNREAAAGSALTSFVIDNNNFDVYYIGNENHVYELAYRTNKWIYLNLTGLAGAPEVAAGSALTSFVIDKYNFDVYYIGNDNHVYELAYRYKWVYVDLTGLAGSPEAAAGSALTSFVIDNNNFGVYYIENDNHVCKLEYRHKWVYVDLTVPLQKNY